MPPTRSWNCHSGHVGVPRSAQKSIVEVCNSRTRKRQGRLPQAGMWTTNRVSVDEMFHRGGSDEEDDLPQNLIRIADKQRSKRFVPPVRVYGCLLQTYWCADDERFMIVLAGVESGGGGEFFF